MLFNEIYSAYYKTVSSIISASQKEELTADTLFALVKKTAFPESVLTIIPALEQGTWPLINTNYTTNIVHTPTMPLSLLQRQWLKSLCADKRIRLFVHEETLTAMQNELADVPPLFLPEAVYLYDAYADGDDVSDEQYIKNFRTAMQAIHTHAALSVEYQNRTGSTKTFSCLPYKMEYSEQDAKFRLVSKRRAQRITCNMARIRHCKIVNTIETKDESLPDFGIASVTLEIYDDRKAMERVLLAFAHYEKKVVQCSGDTYRLTLTYDIQDETELVIRVLSFGPMVKVIEPQQVVQHIRERIEKQMALW